MSNAINVISPYLYNGVWVFDDSRVNLVREPFVFGADDYIDFILKEKGIYEKAKSGFNLFFSDFEFYKYDFVVEKLGYGYSGTFYKSHDDFVNSAGENEFWLCPALNLYYKESPQLVYLSVGLIKNEYF